MYSYKIDKQTQKQKTNETKYPNCRRKLTVMRTQVKNKMTLLIFLKF